MDDVLQQVVSAKQLAQLLSWRSEASRNQSGSLDERSPGSRHRLDAEPLSPAAAIGRDSAAIRPAGRTSRQRSSAAECCPCKPQHTSTA